MELIPAAATQLAKSGLVSHLSQLALRWQSTPTSCQAAASQAVWVCAGYGGSDPLLNQVLLVAVGLVIVLAFLLGRTTADRPLPFAASRAQERFVQPQRSRVAKDGASSRSPRALVSSASRFEDFGAAPRRR